MKTPKIFRAALVALFFTLSLGACKKEADPTPSTRAVFWSKRQDLTTLKPACYIDGKLIGTLSAATATAPACGTPGSISADVTPGVHTFEFRVASGQSLKGDLDVSEGQCRTVELTQ